jgi:hypothetical protein
LLTSIKNNKPSKSKQTTAEEMSEPTSSHVSTGQAAPREAQTQKSSENEPTTTGPDRIDYVDAQECQKTRQREMGEMEDGGVPVKRIHGQAELEAFLGSQALDRILQVLLGISNRTARFGIVRTDKQVVYLRDSILASAPIRAIIHILEQLDLWISDIPLDPAPQRFGNKAFKLWGLRLESVESLSFSCPSTRPTLELIHSLFPSKRKLKSCMRVSSPTITSRSRRNFCTTSKRRLDPSEGWTMGRATK